jgi:hypothetical protein
MNEYQKIIINQMPFPTYKGYHNIEIHSYLGIYVTQKFHIHSRKSGLNSSGVDFTHGKDKTNN